MDEQRIEKLAREVGAKTAKAGEKKYKGMTYGQDDGAWYVVLDHGGLFFVGLDDSKDSGRKRQVEEANNPKAAKDFIDYTIAQKKKKKKKALVHLKDDEEMILDQVYDNPRWYKYIDEEWLFKGEVLYDDFRNDALNKLLDLKLIRGRHNGDVILTNNGVKTWRESGFNTQSRTASNNEEKLIKEMSAMTDHNDHNGAVALLAAHMGARKLVKVMDAIEVVSDYTGHMPRDLQEIRMKISRYLVDQAKRKFGEEIGQRIYMSM